MNVIAFPVLLPLLAGAVLLMLPRLQLRSVVALIFAAMTLLFDVLIFSRTLTGEVLVVQMANWPAPWGISLVADRLTGIMLMLSGVIGFLTVAFMSVTLPFSPRHGQSERLNNMRERFGAQALLQFLFMGVNMSFLTGDLFNLFVAFEVMLIASYGLLLLGNELPQLREGFKYVVVNLIASAIFVAAAGMSYGLFGTLNMADIAVKVAAHGADVRVTMVALMLALVFATKAAVFPLGFWLPNSYPVPAAAVSAFFAAVLTKVGAYTLLRSFTLMFPGEQLPQTILLTLAALTMLMGALGAIARQRWRHTLSFANVASIGYLITGMFIGSQAGLSAALYYLIHSVTVMFTLFLIAALAEKIAGERYHSEGHLALYPWLGVAYFIAALGLAGMPPSSGFIGKFSLISALFGAGSGLHIFVAVCAVLTGFLLLYACVQIWRGFFWGPSDAVHKVRMPTAMKLVTGASVGLLVVLAIVSGPVFNVTRLTAQQLLQNTAYISAVLPAPTDDATPDPATHGAGE